MYIYILLLCITPCMAMELSKPVLNPNQMKSMLTNLQQIADMRREIMMEQLHEKERQETIEEAQQEERNLHLKLKIAVITGATAIVSSGITAAVILSTTFGKCSGD